MPTLAQSDDHSVITKVSGTWTVAYLDVVEDGGGDVGVQVDQSFFLKQLRQRAAATEKKLQKKEIDLLY